MTKKNTTAAAANSAQSNTTNNIINNGLIKAELEASFEKLDETDYDEIISDSLFGDFKIICTREDGYHDTYMTVALTLSRQGEEKYMTDMDERWESLHEIHYADDVAAVAEHIASEIEIADSHRPNHAWSAADMRRARLCV